MDALTKKENLTDIEQTVLVKSGVSDKPGDSNPGCESLVDK